MSKRLILSLIIGVLLLAATTVPAFAQVMGPCNDANGGGMPSGREYAEHHISALAKIGGLGAGAHKPGSHQGFSVCNPSGK